MATITDISELNPNGVYSYADYLTWRFEQVVEIIKGKIWKMSPAPKTGHQRISFKLSGIFYNNTNLKSCDAFAAPFDVRLYNKKKSSKANKDIFSVVQPDLCIICDKEKIDELGCLGAPDLIVEILSRGNSKKEMRVKYDLYEESGVREYWIADPEHQTVHVFALDVDEKYQLSKIYLREDVLQSVIFKDMKIDLQEVFPEENFD
ncbi:MAG: Uma2 family endonuclease [Bacteroidales bacterium]|nr:Uma2 family endonuclease [Bacteroidales bacterium]